MTNDEQDAVWGIVLAAGSGRRFGGRKQFLEACGLRLVDLAVAATARACDHVVLVLPAGIVWDGQLVARTVVGAQTRADSVRAGLAAVPSDAAVVVIHQASNPVASDSLFRAVIEGVRSGADAAAPGLRPPDVIHRAKAGRMIEVVGRDDLVIIQSPGAFRAEVLHRAHACEHEAIEDTAQVAAVGGEVAVVDGDPCNIHVTTPAELALVRCVLAEQAGAVHDR